MPSPRRHPEAPADCLLSVRLTAAELGALHALAASCRVKVSALVRQLLADATGTPRPPAEKAPGALEAMPAPALAPTPSPPPGERPVALEATPEEQAREADDAGPVDVVDLVLDLVKLSAEQSGVGIAAVLDVVLKMERRGFALVDVGGALETLERAGRIKLRARRAVDVRGAERCPPAQWRPGYVLAYAHPLDDECPGIH